jgi:hypothetical protein
MLLVDESEVLDCVARRTNSKSAIRLSYGETQIVREYLSESRISFAITYVQEQAKHVAHTHRQRLVYKDVGWC